MHRFWIILTPEWVFKSMFSVTIFEHLRRTTDPNRCFQILLNFWFIPDRFLVDFVTLSLIRERYLVGFWHRFHDPPNQSKPKAQRNARERFAAPLVGERGVLDGQPRFLQCFGRPLSARCRREVAYVLSISGCGELIIQRGRPMTFMACGRNPSPNAAAEVVILSPSLSSLRRQVLLLGETYNKADEWLGADL